MVAIGSRESNEPSPVEPRVSIGRPANGASQVRRMNDAPTRAHRDLGLLADPQILGPSCWSARGFPSRGSVAVSFLASLRPCGRMVC